MDKHRLTEMRWSMQCLVRVASILVVTLNIVSQHLSSDSEYRKVLKDTIKILFKGIPERYRRVQPWFYKSFIKLVQYIYILMYKLKSLQFFKY